MEKLATEIEILYDILKTDLGLTEVDWDFQDGSRVAESLHTISFHSFKFHVEAVMALKPGHSVVDFVVTAPMQKAVVRVYNDGQVVTARYWYGYVTVRLVTF